MPQNLLVIMKCVLYSVIFFISITTVFSQKALDIDSLENSDIELSKSAFNKLLDTSLVYYNKGNTEKSLRLNLVLLKKALQLDDPYYKYKGYTNIGYDYLFVEDTLLAYESFLKAEVFAKASKNDTMIATSYMNLANVYSLQQKYELALQNLDKSIRNFERIKDSGSLAIAHYNKVLAFYEADKFNKMFAEISEARKFLHTINDETLSMGLDNFEGLYYTYTKEYTKANQILEKVIEEAKAKDFSVELQSAYYDYAENLYQQGDFKKAFDALKKSNELEFKNINKSLSDKSQALSAKFQVSQYRKDAETATLRNELVEQKASRNQILFIAACFVAFILTLFLVYLLISFRKRKKLLEDLRDKNIKYLAAKEKSEELSKAKSTFFSNISHELRTPLYGIIGISSILMDDDELVKHKEDVKSLKFSADYLLSLINDVLHLNKLDAVKEKQLNKQSFHFKELINDIVSSFQFMCAQNNNTMYVSLDTSIPSFIMGDQVKLSQILMNLVGNACKFTENGVISILVKNKEIKEEKVTLHFTIKDTGIGISEEKQQNIFDEFTQVLVKNNFEGTGLGLPIVKKLLSLHNSTISLKTQTDEGTEFSFEITYDISKEKKADKNLSTFINENSLKGRKILVVDDNRINQIVTQKILEKYGAQSFTADNGLLAIENLKSTHYDLVLMDINMPVMNGFEATVEIRKFNPHIPILALTAVGVEELEKDIYTSGMTDIVIKPYDTFKFIKTILKNLPKKKVVHFD